VGVLRLSKNWLIGRLMTVYVEVFRNVPLLLWILLSFVILTETTPRRAPSASPTRWSRQARRPRPR
jgi:ABC-type amino acid transport system permease subunit